MLVNTPSVDLMTLGQRIRRWLREKDISQKELAIASGVHESDLSKIINDNRDPGYSKIEAIINGLGITFAEFFSLGEESYSPAQIPEGMVKEDLEEWREKFTHGRKAIRDLGDEDLADLVRIVRAVVEGDKKKDEAD